MGKKITGIGALTSIILMGIVLIMTMLRGEFFAAFNIQLLIVLLVLTVVFAGLYSLEMMNAAIPKMIKWGIMCYGLFLVIFATLVAFNHIDFTHTYNWLISLGILFVLFVQLQLLQWGKNSALITKICSFTLLLANLFLMIYFIGRWTYSGIELWIDIATLLSVTSFVVGLITLKKAEPTA